MSRDTKSRIVHTMLIYHEYETNYLLLIFTDVPLTARDMNRTHLSSTITRMDAGVEPPWMALRRVDGRCARFMSRIGATLVQACYISLFR